MQPAESGETKRRQTRNPGKFSINPTARKSRTFHVDDQIRISKRSFELVVWNFPYCATWSFPYSATLHTGYDFSPECLGKMTHRSRAEHLTSFCIGHRNVFYRRRLPGVAIPRRSRDCGDFLLCRKSPSAYSALSTCEQTFHAALISTKSN